MMCLPVQQGIERVGLKECQKQPLQEKGYRGHGEWQKGKEKPTKVSKPVGRGTAGMKGGFQPSVKPFHQTIGLRMKGCGVDVCDIEESDEIVPDLLRELQTAIRGDCVRQSEMSNPVHAECFWT
jgi:hypothetical protein